MTRKRWVESEAEQERVIDDLMTRGYSIERRGRSSITMKGNDWGDPPMHVFTFIFSFIVAAVAFEMIELPAAGVLVAAVIANLSYAFYSQYTAEEIIVTIRGTGSSQNRVQ